MRRIFLILALYSIYVRVACSQDLRPIEFPDIPGFHTLVTDLHTHSAFSDGSVWPDIRIQESHRDGLDAIAITEHLEYLPHRTDIPLPDHNRSFEVARQANGDHPLMVIRGAEITRNLPLGHVNAIFIHDANALVAPQGEEFMNVQAVFEEVQQQGGYAFWNHPAWTAQRPDGIAQLEDLHKSLIGAGLLQGIEVANQFTYSDEALQIALDHNLAILATSDIHQLVDWDFEIAEGGHRPVTLVFAKERSRKSMYDALLQRRTVAWHRNTLIGRESEILPLIDSSIEVVNAKFRPRTSVLDVTVRNHSDAKFILHNRSEFTFHEDANLLEVMPQTDTKFALKTLNQEAPYAISFEVLNAVIAPNTHPIITILIEVGDQ